MRLDQFPEAILGPTTALLDTLRDTFAPGGVGLVAAAAAAGIVTGIAFGMLAGAALTRRSVRAALLRLHALAGGDVSSPVAGAGRSDLAGEVARATERTAAALKSSLAREAELRAALAAAESRAEAAARAASETAAPADERAALAAAVAAILAEELAATQAEGEALAAA
jgi:hypothetical protein